MTSPDIWTVLLVWTAASVPLAVLVGRMLKRHDHPHSKDATT